jgi:hypothetical protein
MIKRHRSILLVDLRITLFVGGKFFFKFLRKKSQLYSLNVTYVFIF